jgi:hypothetical protein
MSPTPDSSAGSSIAFDVAVLWPRRLPREVRNNPIRQAECKVYERLDASLDASWTVFYSRPWLGLTPTGEEVDGEADFVVAHPDRGYITLEVKGGGINYDPREERWTSTDRYGVERKIKNPIAQARTAKHQILQKLRASAHWRPRRICARHGVIFPDTLIPARDYGPDIPRRLCCDRAEFEADLGPWLIQRFRTGEDHDAAALGSDGIRALTKLLAEPFQLRVPLGHIIADDERDLELLTQQQFYILAMLEDIPRAAIRGGAGTGKTVLAMESARRLSEGGQRTLLTCYNRALARRMRSMCPAEHDVDSFHSLCRRIAVTAGLAVPENVSARDLYEDILPDLLARAAERRGDLRYQAIVVDEGQDFRPHWWTAIETLLISGGRLQVFYDSNQRVYGDINALPTELHAVPIPLSRNLRNTRSIHAVAMRYYSGYPTQANDIVGVPVQSVIIANLISARKTVSEIVRRLVEAERVPPEQIAVITSREDVCAQIAPRHLIGSYETSPCDEPQEGAVILDTIRRFKGLEARVVLLIMNREILDQPELMYVATSRPRSHLVIVGQKEFLSAAQPTQSAG